MRQFLIPLIFGGLFIVSCKDTTPTPDTVLEGLEVTPIPFTDSLTFTLKHKVKGELTYSLYTLTGHEVESGSLQLSPKNVLNTILVFQELIDGQYILKVGYMDQQVVKHLLKSDNPPPPTE